ncbi:MAG TPA: phosphoribosylanthranilate isomerase [Myxococcales bacterium]|nr:phosphoribosylanthranilate isomerase [Myxococcales bacterium]
MSGVRIKLCGVRTVADALLCAEEGADEIGVVFAQKSRRRVTVQEAKAIRDALPARVPLVGVFLDAALEEVLRIASAVGLQAAQLHGAWPPGPAPLPLYAALQVTSEESLQARPGAVRLLLDGPSGGSGKAFPWALAGKARALHRGELFVAGGLSAENVAGAIREARPEGVDVSGGIEGEDGFKDRARVRAFVRAARGASR